MSLMRYIDPLFFRQTRMRKLSQSAVTLALIHSHPKRFGLLPKRFDVQNHLSAYLLLVRAPVVVLCRSRASEQGERRFLALLEPPQRFLRLFHGSEEVRIAASV
jgi:hypothetical protein